MVERYISPPLVGSILQRYSQTKGKKLPSSAWSYTHKKIKIVTGYPQNWEAGTDVYFSADIETDGPIPGPYSILSIGMVYAGAFNGETFFKPPQYEHQFYTELKPISEKFEVEALAINGLDRDELALKGSAPSIAMTEAASWVRSIAGKGDPVLAAYPLSFDWSWLHWYFVNFSTSGSPFGYSRCFDIKTAIAVKLGRTIASAGRKRIPERLKGGSQHTHHALDDAIEQAQIFANLFAVEYPFD